MKTDLKLPIKTTLDPEGIRQSDIAKLQKRLDQTPLTLPVELDQKKLTKDTRQLIPKGLKSLAADTLKKSLMQALSDLKEADTLLTQISKADEKLTQKQLAQIGNQSFKTAGKYGMRSSDYLSGYQYMSGAGYQHARQMAELSVMAQSAAGMSSDTANQYITAVDQAYAFGGSIEKLTEVLDGSIHIANQHAVSMAELAKGMSLVSSQAAELGLGAQETTAALASMISATGKSGPEAAQAFQEVLSGIHQAADAGTELSALIGANGPQSEQYSLMLDEYAAGAGAMAAEADKTASSWEGSLNRLSNTWVDTIGNIANTDGVVSGIQALNSLLDIVNTLTSSLGAFGSMGLIGGGAAAGQLSKKGLD